MGDQTLDGPVLSGTVTTLDDDEHLLLGMDECALKLDQLDLERAKLALVIAVAGTVVIVVVGHRGSLIRQRAGSGSPRRTRAFAIQMAAKMTQSDAAGKQPADYFSASLTA